MKNNGDRILRATKQTLKSALFEKSRLKYTSNTINSIGYYKQSKNPNSLTCRGFSKFRNPAVFCLPACQPACRKTH